MVQKGRLLGNTPVRRLSGEPSYVSCLRDDVIADRLAHVVLAAVEVAIAREDSENRVLAHGQRRGGEGGEAVAVEGTAAQPNPAVDRVAVVEEDRTRGRRVVAAYRRGEGHRLALDGGVGRRGQE